MQGSNSWNIKNSFIKKTSFIYCKNFSIETTVVPISEQQLLVSILLTFHRNRIHSRNWYLQLLCAINKDRKVFPQLYTKDVNVFLGVQVRCMLYIHTTYVMYIYVQHNVALCLQILLTKNSHQNAAGTQNLPLFYNLVTHQYLLLIQQKIMETTNVRITEDQVKFQFNIYLHCRCWHMNSGYCY